MFDYFRKNYSRKKDNQKIKEDFKTSFFNDGNHQWILENNVTKRSIEALLDALNINQIQFFTKYPTFMVPCQAHLSCAIGRSQNHHLILVFPELVQILKSPSAFHGVAILAHELGHIYHQHTEKKIDTLTAQVEADQFAFDLGFGEELQEVLLDHVHSIDCRVRISKLTAQLITQK